MAAVQSEINDRRRKGTRRQKKTMPRIDMTPMVDLGFLLICFFVISTELSKPVLINLIMPRNGPPMQLGNSNALTVLLSGDNRAWVYSGNWTDAVASEAVSETSLRSTEGLRKIIMDRKKWLGASGSSEGTKGLMLLVKADDHASYGNIVDLLDEVMINDVKKYAIVDMGEAESNWVREHR